MKLMLLKIYQNQQNYWKIRKRQNWKQIFLLNSFKNYKARDFICYSNVCQPNCETVFCCTTVNQYFAAKSWIDVLPIIEIIVFAVSAKYFVNIYIHSFIYLFINFNGQFIVNRKFKNNKQWKICNWCCQNLMTLFIIVRFCCCPMTFA